MYNYSLKLTYNNSSEDNIYRNELMKVFNIELYDGNAINDIINKELIPLVKDYFQPVYETMNKHNRFPFPLDESLCMTLLLSWEYLYLFHPCIGEIKDGKISNTITTLISELKKST
jgi:hypothetical protein